MAGGRRGRAGAEGLLPSCHGLPVLRTGAKVTERPPGPEGSGADSPEAPSGAWCRVGGGTPRLSNRLGPSAQSCGVLAATVWPLGLLVIVIFV